MKKMLFSLIMAVTVLLTACMTADPATLRDFMPETDAALDLGGYEFVIETSWMNQYYPDRADTTEWGERQLDRYAAVGEKYNINIIGRDINEYGYGPTELLTQLLVSGKALPNLIDMHSNEVYDYYKSDMLYPLNYISTIDINDEKWGPEAFRTYGIFNELSYGFFPYEWENMPEYAGGLIYNIELANSKGFSYNVHEMKEQGQWTWEGFEGLLNSMTGVEDVYPLGIRESEGLHYFAKAAIFSNGGNVVEKQNDGTYKFGLDDPKAVKALEWAQGLVSKGLVDMKEDTLSFTRGSSFFHACESYVATHSDDWMEGKYPASVMKDYTFINMPLGPDATEDTVSAYTHAQRRLFWVPAQGTLEMDFVGLIIEDIFEPLDNSPSQAWREMSQNFMYLYEEGYEEFSFGVDNCNYDYTAQLYSVEEALNDALDAIIGGASVTERIKAIQPVVEDAISTELNAE